MPDPDDDDLNWDDLSLWETMLVSESVLSEDWLTPEEDAAWAFLSEQPIPAEAEGADQHTDPSVPATPRKRWLDLLGKAPYPLTGEDAQDWISRSRREADESRARQLEGRKEPKP